MYRYLIMILLLTPFSVAITYTEPQSLNSELTSNNEFRIYGIDFSMTYKAYVEKNGVLTDIDLIPPNKKLTIKKNSYTTINEKMTKKFDPIDKYKSDKKVYDELKKVKNKSEDVPRSEGIEWGWILEMTKKFDPIDKYKSDKNVSDELKKVKNKSEDVPRSEGIEWGWILDNVMLNEYDSIILKLVDSQGINLSNVEETNIYSQYYDVKGILNFNKSNIINKAFLIKPLITMVLYDNCYMSNEGLSLIRMKNNPICGDPLTHSGNVISIIGNSTKGNCTGAPDISLTDVYNEDVLNGWGCVNRNGVQFGLSCRLLIYGNNTNPTCFSEKSKQIAFEGAIDVPGFKGLIELSGGNATATFGTLGNEATKGTKEGVSFIINETLYSGSIFKTGGTFNTLNLYSVSVHTVTGNKAMYAFSPKRMWNGFSDSMDLSSGADSDYFNYMRLSAGNGQFFVYGTPIYENVVVHDTNFCITFESWGSSSANITNFKCTESNWGVHTESSPIAGEYVRFIDSEMNIWNRFTNFEGELIRSCNTELIVRDVLDQTIVNPVNLTITNNYGEIVFNDLITDNATQLIDIGFANKTQNNFYENNPFTITAESDGYFYHVEKRQITCGLSGARIDIKLENNMCIADTQTFIFSESNICVMT